MKYLSKEIFGNPIENWLIAIGILVGSFVFVKILYWVFSNIFQKKSNFEKFLILSWTLIPFLMMLSKVFPIDPVDPNIAIFFFISLNNKIINMKQVLQKLFHQFYLVYRHVQVICFQYL